MGFSRHWVNTCADGLLRGGRRVWRRRRRPTVCRRSGRTSEDFSSIPASFPSPARAGRPCGGGCGEWGRMSPSVLLGTGATEPTVIRRSCARIASTGLPMTVVRCVGATRRRFSAFDQEAKPVAQFVDTSLGYRNDMAHILRSVDVAFIRRGREQRVSALFRMPNRLQWTRGIDAAGSKLLLSFMSGRGIAVEVARTPRQVCGGCERFSRMIGAPALSPAGSSCRALTPLCIRG